MLLYCRRPIEGAGGAGGFAPGGGGGGAAGGGGAWGRLVPLLVSRGQRPETGARPACHGLITQVCQQRQEQLQPLTPGKGHVRPQSKFLSDKNPEKPAH